MRVDFLELVQRPQGSQCPGESVAVEAEHFEVRCTRQIRGQLPTDADAGVAERASASSFDVELGEGGSGEDRLACCVGRDRALKVKCTANEKMYMKAGCTANEKMYMKVGCTANEKMYMKVGCTANKTLFKSGGGLVHSARSLFT